MYDGDSVVKRGCQADLTESCNDPSTCETCQEDVCNIYGPPSYTCIQCSSRDDPKCLTDISAFTPVRCRSSSISNENQCYSRILGDTVQRGCLADIDDYNICQNSFCKTCSGAGCNLDDFKTDWMHCAVCEGNDCTTTDLCENYDDICVTIEEQAGKFIKGCSKTICAGELCNLMPEKCVFCSKHNCNVGAVDITKNQNRNCFSCEGADCQSMYNIIGQCPTIDDSCFTQFSESNSFLVLEYTKFRQIY